MAVEYSCPNCGFAYEIHFDTEDEEPCPNCGAPSKKAEFKKKIELGEIGQ